MLNKEQVEFIVNNIGSNRLKQEFEKCEFDDFLDWYMSDLIYNLMDRKTCCVSDEELEGKPNFREFNTRNAVAEVNGRYFAYDEEYWSKGIREVKPIEVTTIIFNYI